MSARFDFRPYIVGLRVSGPLANAFAQKLVNTAPDPIGPGEKEALDRVVADADTVDRIVNERETLSRGRIKPLLRDAGARWGTLHDALDATSRIPAELGDRGPRALRLVLMLYPDGLTFVTGEADAVWGAGQRRLKRIEEENVGAEIDALVGPEHLAGAREATRKLGEGLGIGPTKRQRPTKKAMQRALNDLSRSIGNYGRVLSALVDEKDEASLDRFRLAMVPIDEYRAAHPQDRGELDEVVEDEDTETDLEVTPEPVAPVPAVG